MKREGEEKKRVRYSGETERYRMRNGKRENGRYLYYLRSTKRWRESFRE